ncbi:MAG: hypothetical protein RBS27_16110 [Giesbergeria sp.]|jgi:hypothetical protein|nr:hypothetical protein [Giesbergeria sp.]
MATDPAMAVPPPSRVQRAWNRVLRHAGAGLLAATAGLAGLAWSTWQLRCESFGCTFVGVVWVALTGLWAVVLILALAFGAAQRRRGLGTRASAWALGLLMALGAGHLLYWLLH